MSKKNPVGSKIFSLRKALELTQGALGEKVGVSRAAISQFELGETLPSPSTLIKLSQALAYDLAEIWQASPNPSTAADDHRMLSFFPFSTYPSLVSYFDAKQTVRGHPALPGVPVLRLPGIDYFGAAVIEVQGDAMAGRYPHGSRYVFRRVTTNLRFSTGVHLFLFNGTTVMFRRIVSNKDGVLTLRADATGEETSFTIQELQELGDAGACHIFKLGQAVHLPPEV